MQVYNSHDGNTGALSFSYGNQIKFRIGDYWYKADYLGYEGLAEYLSCLLLSHTNIPKFASYTLEEIQINNGTFNGCKSIHFLNEKEEIVTAARLFLQHGIDINSFGKIKDIETAITTFVKNVESFTGISDYGIELTRMLEWDGFILNDDRHFNNIAFVYDNNTKSYSPCTLFDHGGAFLSDMRFNYPLEKNVFGLISEVKAKPFSESFDKQIKACEKLYGTQLEIDKEIVIPEHAITEIENMYGTRIIERVCTVFDRQKSLCDYLIDIEIEKDSSSFEEPDLD